MAAGNNKNLMVLLGIGGVALIGALAWSFLGGSEPEVPQAQPVEQVQKAPKPPKEPETPKARSSREEQRVDRARANPNRRDRDAVRTPRTKDEKPKSEPAMGTLD